jgi:4-amino-4-deoxy-L-arabinose transferase-like glycosyltransferase
MKHNDVLLGLLACAAALSARLIVLRGTGFDGLYGQDAYAYHAFAHDLAAFVGEGRALPPFFWPLGYPALLATIGGGVPAGLALSIILGSLLSPLTYLLARQLDQKPHAAAAAALIPALGGQAIQSSLVIMSDVPALFWALISIAALLAYIRGRGTGGWLVVSALTLALSAITRWLYLVLMIPWLVLLMTRRPRPARLAFYLAGAGLVVMPLIIAQAAYSLGNPFPSLNHPYVTGWSPAHILARTFDTPDGHLAYAQTNAVFYAQVGHTLPYLSPLLTILLIGGVALLVVSAGWRTSLLLLAWIALPYVFLVGIPYQNIRFMLIMLPPIALVASTVISRFSPELNTRHPERWLLIGLTCAGLLHTAADGLPYARAFIERQQQDKAILFWARDSLPENARVYTQGLTGALSAYTTLQAVEIWGQTPEALAALPPMTAYVIVNEWQIAHQWAGQSPQIALDWLRQTYGLTWITRVGNWTVYALGSG